jgi:hypothetical protein
MLKQADIAHYLLSLGLVKPRVVVERELRVADVSRRNCVFVATRRGGATYVVKQASPRHARTLAHEAAVLGVLAEARGLGAEVPTVVHYEPQEARLVLRTRSDALGWDKYQGAAGFPRTAARVLGHTLASIHRLPGDHVEDRPRDVDPMWGLSLPEPPHKLVLDLSSGAQDLVSRVQGSRALCGRLEEVRSEGGDGSFVHGDMRWDNCLALAPPGSRRKTRLLLVDWELAGVGAAGFDVGTVLAEYLCCWVGSIPIVEPRDPGRFLARARHPLSRMQPAIHAFWSAYRVGNPRGPILRRVIELAAVRVLQAAVERAQALATSSAHVVTLVQLADNMLRQPHDTAFRLLGLRE